jgi:hypothetical protein
MQIISEDLTSKNSHGKPYAAVFPHPGRPAVKNVPSILAYMPSFFVMHLESVDFRRDRWKFRKEEQRHGHGRIHHGCNNCQFKNRLQTACIVRGILQLRSILSRSTTALLALTSVAPSVSALTVATVATTSTAERPSLALTLAEHASGRSVRPLLLNVGSGDNLGGEVKPFAEVVETLGCEGVVVPLPGELGLDVAAGSQRLASLDNEEVLGVNVGVLGKVEVLGSHEHALTEEVL